MNEIRINELVNVNGNEIREIEGGFGENKRSMFVSDIAKIHQKETRVINQNINRNIENFIIGVDILDLLSITESDSENPIDYVNSRYDLNFPYNTRNIYLLSERGYVKLLKILSDPLSWEMYDNVMDEYFDNRKSLKEISGNNSLDIQNKINNFLLEQEQFKQEVKGQIQELQSYYRPTHKHKISIANHIKKRLNDNQYLFDLAKERIFLSLGIDKWQDIDQKTLNESWSLIDSTIEVLKKEKEITLFNFKDKGC